MQRFRKKPVIIEAQQVIPDDNVLVDNIIRWCGGTQNYPFPIEGKDCLFFIQTLEGIMEVNSWDWVIKGVNGEFYPCRPDIFEKTYEPV